MPASQYEARNRAVRTTAARAPHVELVSLDVLQVKRNRVFSGLLAVDIAYPVCGQVYLALLLVRQLVFPTAAGCVSSIPIGKDGSTGYVCVEARTSLRLRLCLRRPRRQTAGQASLTPHTAPHCPARR